MWKPHAWFWSVTFFKAFNERKKIQDNLKNNWTWLEVFYLTAEVSQNCFWLEHHRHSWAPLAPSHGAGSPQTVMVGMAGQRVLSFSHCSRMMVRTWDSWHVTVPRHHDVWLGSVLQAGQTWKGPSGWSCQGLYSGVKLATSNITLSGKSPNICKFNKDYIIRETWKYFNLNESKNKA